MSRFLKRNDELVEGEIVFVLDTETIKAEISRIFGMYPKKDFLLKFEGDAIQEELFKTITKSPNTLDLLSPQYLENSIHMLGAIFLMDVNHESREHSRSLRFELNRTIAGVDTDFVETLISFFDVKKPKIPFKIMGSLYALNSRKELYERGLKTLSA